MGKDPAFLFYPGDWLGGTITMTRHEKGAYMDLLMAQFNAGHMDAHMVRTVLGENDFSALWEKTLRRKFVTDDDGLFFNEKLEIEIIKRKNFTKSRKENLKSTTHMGNHMSPHMNKHMENENENRNINKKEKEKRGVGKKEKEKEITKPLWAENFENYHPSIIYPFEYPEFAARWDLWIKYRREKRISAYKTIGEQSALQDLSEMAGGSLDTALKIIKQSIDKGWQGLFELKQNGKSNLKGAEAINEISRRVDEFYGAEECAPVGSH